MPILQAPHGLSFSADSVSIQASRPDSNPTLNDTTRAALTTLESTLHEKDNQSFPKRFAEHLHMQRGSETASPTLPQFSLESFRETTAEQKDYDILHGYRLEEDDNKARDGAAIFLNYLHDHKKTLDQATEKDLHSWALMPYVSKTGACVLPDAHALVGAQRLCARAADMNYLSKNSAAKIAKYNLPKLSLELFRKIFAETNLNAKQKAELIVLEYKNSGVSNTRLSGANSFLADLETQKTAFDHATTKHLGVWSLKPNAKENLPDKKTCTGAKELCERAVEAGLIPSERAEDFANFTPPALSLESLRENLAEAGMTDEEKDKEIMLNFQSRYREDGYRTPVNDFRTYLRNRSISLHQATLNDINAWTHTPKANGKLPPAHYQITENNLSMLVSEATLLPLSGKHPREKDAAKPFQKKRKGNNAPSAPSRKRFRAFGTPEPPHPTTINTIKSYAQKPRDLDSRLVAQCSLLAAPLDDQQLAELTEEEKQIYDKLLEENASLPSLPDASTNAIDAIKAHANNPGDLGLRARAECLLLVSPLDRQQLAQLSEVEMKACKELMQ